MRNIILADKVQTLWYSLYPALQFQIWAASQIPSSYLDLPLVPKLYHAVHILVLCPWVALSLVGLASCFKTQLRCLLLLVDFPWPVTPHFLPSATGLPGFLPGETDSSHGLTCQCPPGSVSSLITERAFVSYSPLCVALQNSIWVGWIFNEY